MARRTIGELLLGPTDVSPFMKASITLVCMTGCSLVGFFVQQRLIESYYSGDKAEVLRCCACRVAGIPWLWFACSPDWCSRPQIHRRVKEIQERELREIAMRGGGAEAAAAVPEVARGEGALLRFGGRARDGGG